MQSYIKIHFNGSLIAILRLLIYIQCRRDTQTGKGISGSWRRLPGSSTSTTYGSSRISGTEHVSWRSAAARAGTFCRSPKRDAP